MVLGNLATYALVVLGDFIFRKLGIADPIVYSITLQFFLLKLQNPNIPIWNSIRAIKFYHFFIVGKYIVYKSYPKFNLCPISAALSLFFAIAMHLLLKAPEAAN